VYILVCVYIYIHILYIKVHKIVGYF
jgi:hypothetical protein